MDWMNTLKTLAPTVASALGGPLAGGAVAAIGAILGQSSPTAASIQQAVESAQLTPDHIAELRKLELQFQNDEKERGFKYVELEFKDRDSARQMAMNTKSRVPEFLSYAILIGGGVMIWSVMAGQAKVDSVLAGTLIGYVVAEMKQVLSYWLGSSAGSKDKDDTIAQALKGE